jgi:hypothetical protein
MVRYSAAFGMSPRPERASRPVSGRSLRGRANLTGLLAE